MVKPVYAIIYSMRYNSKIYLTKEQAMKASVDSKIAKYLLDMKLLDQFQYMAVQDHQQKSEGRFHLAVMELGFVPEDRVVSAVSKVLAMPKVDLFKLQMDPDAVKLLDGSFCLINTVYPCALRDRGATLWLAMADPFSASVLQDARKKSKKAIRPLIAKPSEIRDFIRRAYSSVLKAGDFNQGPVIDLSLSEEEEEEEFKITDMYGKTLVRNVGNVTNTGSSSTADGQSGNSKSFSLQERLDRIAANQEKGTKIIKTLVKLCVSKGLFSAEEFSRKRKS